MLASRCGVLAVTLEEVASSTSVPIRSLSKSLEEVREISKGGGEVAQRQGGGGEGEGEGEGERVGEGEEEGMGEGKKRKRKGKGKRKGKRKGKATQDQRKTTPKQDQNDSASDSSSSNGFEVEELLDLKTFNEDDGTSRTAFLVKWKDFGQSENTWETATQISMKYPEAVAAFVAKRGLASTETAAENASLPEVAARLIMVGANEGMISQMTEAEFKNVIVKTLDEACGYAVWEGAVILCLLYLL
jgi:hypothetical protein